MILIEMNGKKFYTVKDFCTINNISKQRFYLLVRQNRIKVVQIKNNPTSKAIMTLVPVDFKFTRMNGGRKSKKEIQAEEAVE